MIRKLAALEEIDIAANFMIDSHWRSVVTSVEAAGLVARRDLGTPKAPHVEYHLTEEGRSLGPVLAALHTWGLARAARAGTPIEP